MELLNGQILGGGVELHTEGTSGGWFNSLSAAPYANHTPQLIDPPVGHGIRNPLLYLADFLSALSQANCYTYLMLQIFSDCIGYVAQILQGTFHLGKHKPCTGLIWFPNNDEVILQSVFLS